MLSERSPAGRRHNCRCFECFLANFQKIACRIDPLSTSEYKIAVLAELAGLAGLAVLAVLAGLAGLAWPGLAWPGLA